MTMEGTHKPIFPSAERLENALKTALQAGHAIPADIRPRAPKTYLPGGLVQLSPRKPCVLVPDLHARPAFVDALLRTEFPNLGESLYAALEQDRASLLFLGDILHAEGEAAARRWTGAYERIAAARDTKAILSSEMDVEMSLSLDALLKVIALECRFPDSVFCLKGNHDNMTNAADHGDFPFYKYADEGRMGALWFELRYGTDIARLIRRYELSLPVAAVGGSYCASHAEPALPLSRSAVIAYSGHPEVVQALIWTANGEAEEGAVAESLQSILGSKEVAQHAVWFSGHRPVSGHFTLRAQGQLVQIHNPGLWQVVFIDTRSERADFFIIAPERAEPEYTVSLVLDPFARQK
jgi:hypothetical protein